MAVKWLLAGIGDIARKRVIPAILQEPRSGLYGVLTRDPRKAQAYAGVKAFTSIEDALADGKFDAAYLAAPVALHAPLTIACLRAGKHVLCEKPTALNYAQAQSMTAAARETGRLFGVAYFRRLFPKLMRAKQLIAQGAIGRPVLAEANNHGWMPATERGWLFDPALAGGGPLYDIACHRIDACNFLFGKPVRAVGLLSNVTHQIAVEDAATVMADYANGARGVVDVRWHSRIERDQFRVLGADGEINLDPLSGPRLKVGNREEDLPNHANVHYPMVEDFVNAILDGTPLACSGEDAIWTDWVTEQAMRANAAAAHLTLA